MTSSPYDESKMSNSSTKPHCKIIVLMIYLISSHVSKTKSKQKKSFTLRDLKCSSSGLLVNVDRVTVLDDSDTVAGEKGWKSTSG